MRAFSSFFRMTSFVLGCVFATAMVVMMTVAAVDSLGLFELDGDAEQQTAADDWETLYLGNSTTVKVFTGIIDDANPDANGDPDMSIFWKGGSKDILDISDWAFKAGSTPDKDQITNAYAAAYSVAQDDGIHKQGDLIVNFGLDRFANNGDAFAGFWFFQDQVGLDAATNSFIGNHAVKDSPVVGDRGDILVLVEYPQGANAVPEIKVYEWDPLDLGNDNVADNLHQIFDSTTTAVTAECETPPQNVNKLACAITNHTDANSPWPYEPKSGVADVFPFESFYEGSINFTQLLGTTPCFSSFLAETRASRSESAKLWDFVLGDFNLCGLKVTKDGDTLGKVTDPADYTFTIENTGAITLYRDSIVDNVLGDLVADPSGYVNNTDCGVSLLAGDSCTISATRTVMAGDPDPLPNEVTAVYNSQSDLSGTAVDDKDDHSINLFQPSFALTKSCPAVSEWTAGQELNFTITIEDTSSADTPDMILLPASVSDTLYLDGSPAASSSITAVKDAAMAFEAAAIAAIKAQAATLPAQGSKVTITLPFTPPVAGNWKNEVTMKYSPDDAPDGKVFDNQIGPTGGPASDTCPVVAPGPATLFIEKELRGGEGLAFRYLGQDINGTTPSTIFGISLTPTFANAPGSGTSPLGAVGAGSSYAISSAQTLTTVFGATQDYTAAELFAATGYTFPANVNFDSVSCNVSGDGSSYVVQGTNSEEVKLTVAEDAIIHCRWINNVQPELKLVKTVTNDDGGTAVADDWTLTAVSQGGDASRNISTAGGSGTFDQVFANVGYDLSESNVPGYTDGNWSCDGGSLSGSTVTLGYGDQVTCTINNDDNPPTLKLVKTVTNDDGGTGVPNDWTLTAAAASPNDGRNFSNLGGSGTFVTVFANAGYDLSENNIPGYTAGSWSCDGGSLSGSTITLGLDDDVTCTINNDDDPPTLKLVKVVINDNGGTAVADNWTLSANSTAGRSFSNAGGSGNFETVFANAGYDLSESSLAGYAQFGSWSCDGGSLSGSTVTLDVAEAVTCTVTNKDIPPTLKLVKAVINDNGGTAVPDNWTLFANSAAGRSFNNAGGSGNFETVYANAGYDLSESSLAGYAQFGSWSCDGGSLSGSTVTLDLDTAVTCTVTNKDIPPTLKLVKAVINDNGGTAVPNDWTLSANSTAGRSFSNAGGSGNFETVFANAGYDLSETALAGYAQFGSWSCDGGSLSGSTVTLGLADTVTCTVTNKDIPPTLKLVKAVINDNGGTAVANDWTLSANSTAGRSFSNAGGSGNFETVFANAGYDLSETALAGYAQFGSWSCDGGSLSGSTVTLGLDDDVTCTVTNKDIPPTLKLVKVVLNENGGTAVANDWTLSANSSAGRSFSNAGGSGNFETVFANAGYDLSETSVAGYAQFGSWSCDGGSLSGSTVTLGLDADVTCTVTNKDIPPELKLVKTVTNNDGGTAVPDDWDLFADAAAPNDGRNFSTAGGSGVFETVFANAGYSLSEANGPMAYEAGDWSCDGGSLSGSTVTLGLADKVTCTINNDDLLVEFCPEPGVSGRPRELTMMYDGVSDKTGPQSGNEVIIDPFNVVAPALVDVEVYGHTGNFVDRFNGLAVGDEFSYRGFKGGVSPRTRFLIYEAGTDNLIQTVQFHTSCSQPINLGDSYGLLTVSGGILGN